MCDTDRKIGAEVRAVLARHRVLESALLETLKALPPADAARLARDLRACVDEPPSPAPATRQVAIRPWSFLREGGVFPP